MITPIPHRTIRGKIRYTSKKPERLDQERGREWFTVTKHGDGSRTIRAMCEIEEPEPTVLRDVIYSVGPNDRPKDCLIRLTVGDTFLGSGFFKISDELIECESYGPSIGRVSQQMRIEGPWDAFGSHPIVCDGFNMRTMDVAKGPHKRRRRGFLPSLDHRGAGAPIVAENRSYLEYLGDEPVTTPAGTFECRRFRFTDEDEWMMSAQGAHPVYDVWVTADDDWIFVQGGVGGYMQTWYELVELER